MKLTQTISGEKICEKRSEKLSEKRSGKLSEKRSEKRGEKRVKKNTGGLPLTFFLTTFSHRFSLRVSTGVFEPKIVCFTRFSLCVSFIGGKMLRKS